MELPLIPQAELEAMLHTHGVQGISIAVLTPTGAAGDSAVRVQTAGLADVESNTPLADSTFLEIASLSKPIAAAFAIDYFARAGIPLDAPVAPLLEAAEAPYQLTSAEGKPAEWADQLTLRQLMDHTGLGMHYVNGVPLDDPFPPVLDLISGSAAKPAPYGYMSLEMQKEPGTAFGYSGGGYLLLQHLLECREKKPVADIMAPYLRGCGTAVNLGITFEPKPYGKHIASGYYDGGKPVPLGRKTFPPLSAGALGSAAALADWLRHLCLAYHRPQGSGAISHAAARAMLTPSAKGDLGSEAFMSAAMGVGMFVFDAVPTSTTKPAGGGPAAASRWMLHQAANDGFRGVLLICFDGPDARDGPRGVVVLANGDNAAVGLFAVVLRALLTSSSAFSPPLAGLDWTDIPRHEDFSTAGMKQEEIVNLGLKELVLKAFVKPAGGVFEATPPAQPPVAGKRARGGLRRSK